MSLTRVIFLTTCQLRICPKALGIRMTSTTSKVSEPIRSALKDRNTHESLTASSTKLHALFARDKVGGFFQDEPSLSNQFAEDVTLKNFLRRHITDDKVYNTAAADLTNFGSRVGKELYQLSLECEQNPPKLEHYNAWGKRVDNIVTCEAWKKMKTVSAEEGLIAIAYERKFGPISRLVQMAKLYLFAPSSGLYSCPLAMTDGAAKTIEHLQATDDAVLGNAYSHLISRDPHKFWTSGQWMTERKGGSDVASGCETLAFPQADGSFKLHGYKWFSSATDSNMTFTLGRVMDPSTQSVVQGTKGLSMFYLNTRDPDTDELNCIQVQRLKDKLGTRQLPTAELLLDGCRAFKASEEGRGVPAISSMLTVTRLHNSLAAASSMRRIINLARDYSHKRECFGRLIKDHALHTRTLAKMEVEARAALVFVLELARFLGLDDCDQATDHTQVLLRLLTPVCKLYTAKQAVAVVSEGLEAMGGAGYLEDTGFPAILRDAQVLPIWEGTTNILSLDVLRAIQKSSGSVLRTFVSDVSQRLSAVKSSDLQEPIGKVLQSANDIAAFAVTNTASLELVAREFAYSLARTYMGTLLIEHAAAPTTTTSDIVTAQRWCAQDLAPVLSCEKQLKSSSDDYDLLFQGYKESKL